MQKCVKCGHTWYPRGETKNCPKCKTKYWRGETATGIPTPEPAPQVKPTDTGKQMKCAKCGNEWTPRKDAPKNCPKCKTVLGANQKKSSPQTLARWTGQATALGGPVVSVSSDVERFLRVVDQNGQDQGYVRNDPAVIVTDLTGLNVNDYFPVLDIGDSFVGGTVLRGWVHTNFPIKTRRPLDRETWEDFEEVNSETDQIIAQTLAAWNRMR